MFRIGDFSRMAQVTIRTLRLYDELGLLKPAHIDKFTDYRYYTIEQLPRLNRILALKEMGFSLEEITRLLDGNLPTPRLWEMLAQKQTEIEHEVQAAQFRLARVQSRLKQIEQEGQPPRFDVILKKAEPLVVASVREMVPDLAQMVPVRCRQGVDLYTALKAQGIRPLEPEICIYHNSEFTETEIDTELATVVDKAAKVTAPLTVHTLPAAEAMASVVYRGDLRNVTEPIIALFQWMGQHGYTSDGPIREIHLWGRENDTPVPDLCDITLEVQIPITPLDSHAA